MSMFCAPVIIYKFVVDGSDVMLYTPAIYYNFAVDGSDVNVSSICIYPYKINVTYL